MAASAARCVVDAVAGHGHDVAATRRAPAIRSFSSGTCGRRTTRRGRQAHRAASRLMGGLRPVTTTSSPTKQTDLSSDGSRASTVVAVTIATRMPRGGTRERLTVPSAQSSGATSPSSRRSCPVSASWTVEGMPLDGAEPRSASARRPAGPAHLLQRLASSQAEAKAARERRRRHALDHHCAYPSPRTSTATRRTSNGEDAAVSVVRSRSSSIASADAAGEGVPAPPPSSRPSRPATPPPRYARQDRRRAPTVPGASPVACPAEVGSGVQSTSAHRDVNPRPMTTIKSRRGMSTASNNHPIS